MLKINELKEKLQSAKSAVILSHKSPDGDSIGSSLAVYNYLKKLEIPSQVITPDQSPDFLSWMKGYDEMMSHDQNSSKADELIASSDLIFCLDFNDPSRTGGIESALVENTSAYKINIDHHQEPKDFCHLQYVDTAASSTAELVYNFIEELGDLELLDTALAECLYTGILTDTGSFRFSSTTERTHYIASKLIALGVRPDEVNRNVYDSYSAERLRLLGYSLYHSLKLFEDGKVAIIDLSSDELKKFNFKRGDTEGLVNFPLSIQSVLISILLTEKDGLIKMSFRSKGEIAVNQFAKKFFDGGGHINAAGGASKDSMQATLEKLTKNLDFFFVR